MLGLKLNHVIKKGPQLSDLSTFKLSIYRYSDDPSIQSIDVSH